MSDTKQKRGAYARVEFIKNIDEINKLLSEGHPITFVYKTLFDAKKITMPYRTFYNHVRPDVAERHRKKKRQEKK